MSARRSGKHLNINYVFRYFCRHNLHNILGDTLWNRRYFSVRAYFGTNTPYENYARGINEDWGKSSA